ncbi:MAG: hypothetical protein QM710_02385 [Flavobacterium sp.]
MKKLIFGVIAVVMTGNLSFGQEFKTSYESYKKSTQVFYSKLNEFDKNLKTEVTNPAVFKTEESFSNWLKDNLSKTNYKNPQDAIKDYNEQINLITEVIKKNSDFLKQLKNNEKEFLSLLAESPLIGIPITTVVPLPANTALNFPCISECINNAVKCSKDADKTFSDTMISSAAAFATGNVISAAAIAYIGSRAHSRAIAACRTTLLSCADGCD